MKKRITAKALAKYIAKHPGDFEEVDTGYRSRNGEKPVKEWIYQKTGGLKSSMAFIKRSKPGTEPSIFSGYAAKPAWNVTVTSGCSPFLSCAGCAYSYTPWLRCCIPFLPERSCAARAGCSPGVAAPGTRCPFMANTPQFTGGGSAILKIYIVK